MNCNYLNIHFLNQDKGHNSNNNLSSLDIEHMNCNRYNNLHNPHCMNP